MSRASLGSDISELVACRGLNEAEDAVINVVTHKTPAKVHVLGAALEGSMVKERDGASVVFSDRRRARLDEAQLRCELTTKVLFLSAGSHADELSLTRRESEDRSKS